MDKSDGCRMSLFLIEDSGNCIKLAVSNRGCWTYVDIALYKLPRVRLGDDMIAHFCYSTRHLVARFLYRNLYELRYTDQNIPLDPAWLYTSSEGRRLLILIRRRHMLTIIKSNRFYFISGYISLRRCPVSIPGYRHGLIFGRQVR